MEERKEEIGGIRKEDRRVYCELVAELNERVETLDIRESSELVGEWFLSGNHFVR